MAENKSSEIKPGLYLIGMGPGRLELMTEEALFYATQCTQRYYEAYTALWQDHELIRLEQRVGPLERVMRPFIEHPEELLERASQDAVAVMVVGDPLQATTHEPTSSSGSIICRSVAVWLLKSMWQQLSSVFVQFGLLSLFCGPIEWKTRVTFFLAGSLLLVVSLKSSFSYSTLPSFT